MNPPQKSSASRLLFLDWLRAWALLVMVETHVSNAFLLSEIRAAGWFRAVNFFNGLVAPAFLFVSGFVFLVAAQKRLEELRGLGRPFWRQVGRVGMVWAIGYLMHLPSYSPLALARGVTEDQWLSFYRVDVLHTIAATWIFLLLSLIVVRSERWQSLWFAGCAVALTAFAPLVWSIEFRPFLPAPLAAYLNIKTGSLFPLFPWSAFMLAGAAFASWFVGARRRGMERPFMLQLAVLGIACILVGQFAGPFRFLPEAASTNWWADPRAFLLRLGIVLLLLGACYCYGLARTPRKSPLLDVSRESLFVYVAHLLLIYGPFWGGRSTAEVVGRTQGPVTCLVASVALASLMVAGARAWSALKQRKILPHGR